MKTKADLLKGNYKPKTTRQIHQTLEVKLKLMEWIGILSFVYITTRFTFRYALCRTGGGDVCVFAC